MANVQPPSFADPDVDEILLAANEIQTMVADLGRQISRDYAGLNPVLVSILKGSAFLMADLLRTIDVEIEVDFIAITSYGPSTRSSGVVRLTKDLDHSIEDRHVLLIEDIIDTGLTLNYVMKLLRGRHPRSLDVGTLLNKPARRLVNIGLRYKGFDLPDRFVVGYGLDFQQKYRNLPYICVLKPDVIVR